ncbi:ankyrin repeat domain-containing protein [Parashewanella curva]|uniref:Ankyrin repeat domain-containing protein n=1 Tax=Parashewanella curva TaxID=2338552 RepID=A0A3L8PXU4_9GAMM|nr:ankyrin repeat domain-containing protein [Parashewanella curva]RLV60124.1 ankyrin repeat domain-containing protein [Parashewanella curva]
MAEAISARFNEYSTVANSLQLATCRRGAIRDGDVVQVETRLGLRAYKIRISNNRCYDVIRQDIFEPDDLPFVDVISTAICKYFGVTTSDAIRDVYNSCEGDFFRALQERGLSYSVVKEYPSDRRTPLQHAISAVNEPNTKEEIQRAMQGVNYVAERGMFFPDRLDQNGQTELHTVAVYGHFQLIPRYRFLLSPRRLSTYNREGLTPLHLAVINRRYYTAKNLLAIGASVHPRTNPTIPGYNCNAVDFAVDNFDLKMLELLLSYKAKPGYSIAQEREYDPLARLDRAYRAQQSSNNFNQEQKEQLIDTYQLMRKLLIEGFLNNTVSGV